jgi:DNA-binding response OmpR family regulator
VKVLIAEDDAKLRKLVVQCFEAQGIRAVEVSSGADVLTVARNERPDLIVLDLELPERHGLDVCRDLRRDAALSDTPIIISTGRGEEVDRVVGLEIGADDYVVKPFSVRELVLRAKAVLRRTHGRTHTNERHFGALHVDIGARRVSVAGAPVELTAKEFELLVALLNAGGRVLTRAFLLESAWQYAHGHVRTRTVDVHIRQLRKKLGSEAARIETVERVGYRFNIGA